MGATNDPHLGVYVKGSGTGTFADPFIPEVTGIADGIAGSVSIADGNDATLGAKADAPSTAVEDATARTGISLWKGIKNYLRTLVTSLLPASLGQKAMAASLAVTVASDQSAVPTQLPTAAALADGAAATPTTPTVGAVALLMNGATLDRQRNNHELTAFASAERDASANSADLVNHNARFARITIDITAIAGSPSLVFTVKAKDTLSGKYTTILASAALVGTGTTVLKIGPGLTAAGNLVVNDVLPRIFRIEAVAGTADAVSYSVSVNLVN